MMKFIKLKKLKKLRSSYSLLVFCLLLLQFLSNGSNLSPTTAITSFSSSLSLTDYDGNYSLHISSDLELLAASSGGIGTQNDPYILEGLEIVNVENYGIKIESTTRYFIIRNNLISGYTSSSNNSYVIYGEEPSQKTVSGSGIVIENVTAGTTSIYNNSISSFNEAISIISSQNTTIEGNECFNNEVGTSLFSSEFSIVINNSYSNNARYGIYCASDNVTLANNFFTENYLSIFATANSLLLENNTLTNNSEGIVLYLSSNIIARNNTLIDNTIGINAFYSEKLTLENNTMINCGLAITIDHEGFSSAEEIEILNDYTVSNNTVNSLPLGYLTNQENDTIGINYGQLFLINSTRITVENQSYSYTSVGIALYYGSNSILQNNSCSYNNIGFYLFHSTNTTLEGNRCNYSQKEGIEVISSDNSTLINNLCTDSGLGINISATINVELNNNTATGITLSACINATVVNNTLTKEGLLFEQSSLSDLLSNVVIDNTINGKAIGFIVNTQDETISSSFGQLIIINSSRLLISGVDCSMASNGISFFYSSSCEVTNSIFNLNSKAGIYSLRSDNLSITDNQFSNNTNKGVYFVNSPNATIIQNTCNFNRNGIEILNSEFTEISENTCYDNGNDQKITNLLSPSYETGAGIVLINSSYSQISENNGTSNQISIAVHSSYSVKIEDNYLEGGIYGVYLYYSQHSEVTNNNLMDCVLLIVDNTPENYRSYQVEENSVNELELGFFMDISDITIDESIYGQILMIFCRRVIVENQIIDSTIGIRLIECIDCEILANECNSNVIGIVAESSSNVLIRDNNCLNNSFAGIYAFASEDLIITENGCTASNPTLEYNMPSSILVVKSNDTEITENECSGSYALSITQSHNVEVTDNQFIDNIVGILLYQSVVSSQTEENPWGRWHSYDYSSSNNCTIANNNLSYNNYGIYAEQTRFALITGNFLTDNTVGIILDYSLGTEIIYNQVANSQGKGIFSYHSNENVIHTNLFVYNEGHGVYLDVSSVANQLMSNIFINNTNNALDNGQSNLWYDPVDLSGNYWDDFVAGQHSIPGETGSVDPYPITTLDLTDYDGDFIPNDWEQANGLNPLVDDASDDLDNDGLSNLDEFNQGTDPNNADTDGDGFSDGEEIDFGSDPLDASSNKEATYDYYREIVLIAVSTIIGLPLLIYYIKEYFRIRKVAAEQSIKLPLIIQQVTVWNNEIIDMGKKLEIITTEVELVGFLSRSNELTPEIAEVQEYISCIQKTWLLKLRIRKSFKELRRLVKELKENYDELFEKLIMSTKMQEIIKV
ncbi:MAG: NosD domain-containing protein [Candidatus Kariarchaeaceae archaeon]